MRKLSFKKIFCLISFIFLISCCIFYGYRFIKLYLENEKNKQIEKNYLVKLIKDSNEDNENFKKINNDFYFINDSTNNYLIYSNILWRIIRINEDNSITAIANHSITSLAYGTDIEYSDSYINKWLNKNDDPFSGILEKELHDVDTYLQKTTTCLDKVDTLSNKQCENTNNDNYFSLLSTIDFVNIGNKQSFVINNEYFYLNNTNTNNEVWYVTDDGKLTVNDGSEIIGIKPVITTKANLEYISGDGSKDKPYTIEEENSLFGSYVKLGNDIWRIYRVNSTDIRLVLNDYLKTNNENLKYIYNNINNNNSNYAYSSIAYYLNNTYLNSLSYKNKLNDVDWTNGYYGDSTNYDYQQSLENTVKRKVGLLSMGNIILNNGLDNYYTMTSTADNGTSMYTLKANQKIYTKNIQSKANIVPTISINKDLLTKGKGTIDSPYEME